MPERSSPLWEQEGFCKGSDSPTGPGYCIADSWLSQGYQIKALHLPEKRVVFRKVVQNESGLVLPKALLAKKLPDNAVYEINQFFKYIVRKYGLNM